MHPKTIVLPFVGLVLLAVGCGRRSDSGTPDGTLDPNALPFASAPAAPAASSATPAVSSLAAPTASRFSPRASASVAATGSVVHDAAARTAFSKSPAKGTTKRLATAPCIGAIAIDADTGRVLLEENADALALPASMTKMMLLLLLQERIEAGTIATNDLVAVSKRAFSTGGSQVYLDPRESFPVEDLVYALMIQSANDAAVALAEHAAGSCEAMVALMNQRAVELGMRNTHFESVHGLPAPAGEPNDVTTPRDMAILSAELCSHPDALRYTSTAYRVFRPAKPFEMRTHNPLLHPQRGTPGCDGLKTGYTKYAGYSIAASVVRGGRRVVVVQMGSPDKDTRNAKLDALLSAAFTALATQPPSP